MPSRGSSARRVKRTPRYDGPIGAAPARPHPFEEGRWQTRLRMRQVAYNCSRTVGGDGRLAVPHMAWAPTSTLFGGGGRVQRDASVDGESHGRPADLGS